MGVKETGAQITRDKLPEVWGDSTLLTELYQNLISNALKFSGDQPPIIQLTSEERDGDQIFGVKDNGIGIDPKYAQQIFQPFRRLHGRAEYEGSGIGLAICRKIADRHGGKIWVESESGKGAHFRFTISPRRGGTMRTVNRRTPAPLIILVEDDRGDLELVQGWPLQGAGSEIGKNIMHTFMA